MPSWAATRRASSTSATLQHPESDSPPHSLRVTPVTSWPEATSRAAATDESTPPLMATSTLMGSAPLRDSARQQAARPGGDDGDGLVDLGFGGGPSHGEPDRGAGLVDGQAHGGQDVRRFEGPRGARRTGRGADAVTVQQQEEGLGLEA